MKHLITSGCSFSDYENPEITWPLHLQDLIQDKYDKFHHLANSQKLFTERWF